MSQLRTASPMSSTRSAVGRNVTATGSAASQLSDQQQRDQADGDRDHQRHRGAGSRRQRGCRGNRVVGGFYCRLSLRRSLFGSRGKLAVGFDTRSGGQVSLGGGRLLGGRFPVVRLLCRRLLGGGFRGLLRVFRGLGG